MGDSDEFERPEGLNLRTVLPDDPKLLGAEGDTTEAIVRVDAARAAAVTASSVPIVSSRRCPTAMSTSAFRAPTARRSGRGCSACSNTPRSDHPPTCAPTSSTGSNARRPADGARPRGAEERLRRLLVMLPWLMERGEVPLAEVAERFRLTESQVAADLELVAMCGLPPFVDELIDIFIDEGTVFVGVPRLFTRPLRLNSTEAFELLAAGRAAMELPGADAVGPARARAGQTRRRAGRRRTHSIPGSARGSTSTSSDRRPPIRSPTRRAGSNGCASRTGARRATSRPNA